MYNVGRLKMCHKIILKNPGKVQLVLNKVIGYLAHEALGLKVPGTGDCALGSIIT